MPFENTFSFLDGHVRGPFWAISVKRFNRYWPFRPNVIYIFKYFSTAPLYLRSLQGTCEMRHNSRWILKKLGWVRDNNARYEVESARCDIKNARCKIKRCEMHLAFSIIDIALWPCLGTAWYSLWVTQYISDCFPHWNLILKSHWTSAPRLTKLLVVPLTSLLKWSYWLSALQVCLFRSNVSMT